MYVALGVIVLCEHIEILREHICTCYGSSDPKTYTEGLPLEKKHKKYWPIRYIDHVLLYSILAGKQAHHHPCCMRPPLREKVILIYNPVRPVSHWHLVLAGGKKK